MGKESTSWEWLRDGVRKALPAFSLMERVENGVLFGMADVNCIVRGVESWIEMKAVALPAREDTAVLGLKGLNKKQVNWHLARQQVLGKTWIFVTAAPYRWLIHGTYAAKINGWNRDMLSIHAQMWYDDKWKKQQWDQLIRSLAS